MFSSLSGSLPPRMNTPALSVVLLQLWPLSSTTDSAWALLHRHRHMLAWELVSHHGLGASCEDLQHQPEPAVHSLEVRLDKDRGQAVTSVSRGFSRSCVWPGSGQAGMLLTILRSGQVFRTEHAQWSSSLCLMVGGTYEVSQDPSLEFSMVGPATAY
ncbi:hypothetical protein INR49_011014 [Caranx melampygus]|nr:hypothetical protein INR49_011014 [Caranx melampygus]